MGSSASQEDQVPLLGHDEEIKPIFEELKLVLIGSHGAGKNTIANAILKENVFTFWRFYKSVHIKETRSVSGTQIHLARTPGWRGDLSRSKKIKLEIVHCVQSLFRPGPHAVILALKVDLMLSESNISTLENLLTVQLWEHTIVVFTNGEKLRGCTIEDYIRCQQLQPLINKCGKRYFVIQKNDSNQITEIIQEFIARKNSACYFKISSQTEDNNTLLSDWNRLVERLKSKITTLSDFKVKLLVKLKTQNNNSIQTLLDLKDAEIQRLNEIVQEKETEINSLKSRNLRTQDLDLEDQLDMMRNKLKGMNTENTILKKQINEKDAKIEELKTELQMWRQRAADCRTHYIPNETVHAGYCSNLCQGVSEISIRSCNQIQLQVLPSNGSALHGWSDTLPQILNELCDEDLKKMKYYMYWKEEYKMTRSSVEHRDRVELADQMLKQWGELRSVLNIRDLLKKIPRNDDAIKGLIEPFLNSIGETW